ncbi:carbon monoxide dehydrogenase [Streptomyces sp. NBC_00378]|uniref:carbon monoxide dehydrogenase n=1 Tax=unclassified Streptomyces TaxID=2593676 RepID=UPI002252522B|nr:carbon monoxide dehydrogenase [Streptomyces sp. NBC_00378]MCX5111028.1 carbon monoxide dehydrogenase [Streptomyces sp. NBC_00378]
MEHEVFVPVPVPSLRRTLGDPARVARCVPGLQQDADSSAGPLSGRLRIRVDGHTITYRGALRLTDAPQDGPQGSPGAGAGVGILVTGEGAEARGSGSVKLSLTIGLTERDGGTAIGFTGTASGDGRLLELDAAAVLAAARRLLDRFAQQLVTETLAATGEPDGPLGEAVEQAIEEAAEEADATGAATARDITPEAVGPDDTDDVPPTHEAAADEAPSAGQPGEPGTPGNPPGTGSGSGSVFDAPVPPPSLDPVSETEFTAPGNPPAEAAHARRTMIGRSAEEVDHAPPRGRYAPVPSPDSTTAGATLRWVAPAAALALASAVVVTRALRRRR